MEEKEVFELEYTIEPIKQGYSNQKRDLILVWEQYTIIAKWIILLNLIR